MQGTEEQRQNAVNRTVALLIQSVSTAVTLGVLDTFEVDFGIVTKSGKEIPMKLKLELLDKIPEIKPEGQAAVDDLKDAFKYNKSKIKVE